MNEAEPVRKSSTEPVWKLAVPATVQPNFSYKAVSLTKDGLYKVGANLTKEEQEEQERSEEKQSPSS